MHSGQGFIRLKQLDGLRGVLALYIIGVHILTNVPGCPLFLKNIFTNGQIAVKIFFCLSGFFISHSFVTRKSLGTFSIRDFLVRRVARIIPLWWLILFVIYGFGYINTYVLLLNMFFVFGFVLYDVWKAPIPASWSLFVEEIYYFSYALGFYRFKTLFLYLSFFFTCFVSRVWNSSAAGWGIPTGNSFINKFPLNHFQYFFLGMIIFNLFNSKSPLIFAGRKRYDLIFIVVLILILTKIDVPNEVLVGLVVLSLLNPNTMVQKIFHLDFLRWSGVRCYFIYIAHGPIRIVTKPLIQPLLDTISTGPSAEKVLTHFGLLVVMTLILASLSFKYFETPCMRIAERFMKK